MTLEKMCSIAGEGSDREAPRHESQPSIWCHADHQPSVVPGDYVMMVEAIMMVEVFMMLSIYGELDKKWFMVIRCWKLNKNRWKWLDDYI